MSPANQTAELAHVGRSTLLVIGGGPAGAAAAIAARQEGVDVCLVDRATFPRGKTCGDAISNQAIQLIAELGAGVALQSAPHAEVLGATAVLPDGTHIKRSYHAEPGFIVPRLHLDALLLQAAIDSGAQVIQGAAVRSLSRDGDTLWAQGNQLSWHAQAVIAADGPGTVASSLLDLQRAAPRSGGVAITGYYENLGAPQTPDYSEHYFDPEIPCGYGWTFPEVEGLSNVGVYLRTDQLKSRKLQLPRLLAHFLEAHPDRFAGARRVGPTRTWQLPLAGPTAAAAAPGILTAGDAAQLIDPLTGEGIWQALFSGHLAGQIAARALLERGVVDERAASRYRQKVLRRVVWPGRARRRIQDGLEVVIDRGWYRHRAVKQTLAWGYSRSLLEVTKTVS